jgi:hypothetical protein
MTAKEKLRDMVDGLSEAGAEDVLDYIVAHRGPEPVAPAASPEPTPALTWGNPKPRVHRGRLATMATIPAWLFVGLFLSVYLAMAVVILVVIVKG